MSTESAQTIIKMLETLPEHAQNQVIDHLCEYIQELREETIWRETFIRTEEKLVHRARQVKKEISEGKSAPMDIEQL